MSKGYTLDGGCSHVRLLAVTVIDGEQVAVYCDDSGQQRMMRWAKWQVRAMPDARGVIDHE